MDELAVIAMSLAGKSLPVRHIAGPTGPRFRINDSTLLRRTLGWAPEISLVPMRLLTAACVV
jgi:hypothetical protein